MHPHQHGVEAPLDPRHVRRMHEEVSPADVHLVGEAQRDGHRSEGLGEGGARLVDGRHRRLATRGKRHDHVPHPHDAGGDLRGVAAVVERRPEHGLDRVAKVFEVPSAVHRDALEELEHRGALVKGRALAAGDDVVAAERADGHVGDAAERELPGEGPEVLANALVDGRVEADEVHLVHADEEVRDPEELGDVRVTARLLEHAEPRVDEDHGDVRRRRAGRHVARVLHVPRRVGDDELPLVGREVAISDVDGDALLALGLQAVGEEREVDLGVGRAPALHRRATDGAELVFVDALGVVEQPADERRLAVVHRADGDEAQHVLVLVAFEVREDVVLGGGASFGHQKYPSRFFVSMEPSSS